MTASPSGCCLHQVAAVLSPGTLPSWVPPLLRSLCEPMVWSVPDDSGTQVRLPASPTGIIGVEFRAMARHVRPGQPRAARRARGNTGWCAPCATSSDGGWTRSGEADVQNEVPEPEVEYSAAGRVHDERQQDDG